MAVDRSQVEAWERKLEQYGRQAETLQNGGGGGTSGGVTDDWKESVNRQLDLLHGDMRALLNRGVAAVVALAALIGGLYLYTNDRFERVSERLTAMEVQQAKTDGKLDTIIERLPAPQPSASPKS